MCTGICVVFVKYFWNCFSKRKRLQCVDDVINLIKASAMGAKEVVSLHY